MLGIRHRFSRKTRMGNLTWDLRLAGKVASGTDNNLGWQKGYSGPICNICKGRGWPESSEPSVCDICGGTGVPCTLYE